MNEKLMDYIKEIPPVYHESSKPFWDDAHISKNMLEAHLATDMDGASRKLTTIQKSVHWICECWPDMRNRRLLDLGCGAGLYAELLHDKGFSVTGIDFSRRSIEYARRHAEETARKIQYHYQDYLEMDAEQAFDVVILIYCDFGVLSPENRKRLLEKVRRSLRPGGIFLLDVFNRPHLSLFQAVERIQYEKSGFWSPEPHVVIQRNRYYEKTENTLEQYVIVTGSGCECFNIWNQIYSPETFAEELEQAGFITAGLYDNVTGTVYTGQAETICGIFRPRAFSGT